jgi:glycosyltransferase involved in cell wall biosynthesis
MVSVIIPARKERFLNKTIDEVKSKFGDDYEIIVTLDGKPKTELVDGVKYIHNKEPKGMRTAINQAVALAGGKYLMKLDAHCMLDKNIDLKLIKIHQDNWVQIPRRKRLDAHKWEVDSSKNDVDYMYLNSDFMGIVNRGANKDPKKKKILIDDTESFQGSCYFIERGYFHKLGFLDDKNFSGSGHESQEISIKVKHDGGRIVRNKKTWYAHARLGRFYASDKDKSRVYIKKYAKKYEYKKD